MPSMRRRVVILYSIGLAAIMVPILAAILLAAYMSVDRQRDRASAMAADIFVVVVWQGLTVTNDPPDDALTGKNNCANRETHGMSKLRVADHHFGAAAADVDNHVADGFVDVEVGTNCSSHWLLEQLRICGAGTTCCIRDCTALHFRNCRWNTDQNLWS